MKQNDSKKRSKIGFLLLSLLVLFGHEISNAQETNPERKYSADHLAYKEHVRDFRHEYERKIGLLAEKVNVLEQHTDLRGDQMIMELKNQLATLDQAYAKLEFDTEKTWQKRKSNIEYQKNKLQTEFQKVHSVVEETINTNLDDSLRRDLGNLNR